MKGRSGGSIQLQEASQPRMRIDLLPLFVILKLRAINSPGEATPNDFALESTNSGSPLASAKANPIAPNPPNAQNASVRETKATDTKRAPDHLDNQARFPGKICGWIACSVSIFSTFPETDVLLANPGVAVGNEAESRWSPLSSSEHVDFGLGPEGNLAPGQIASDLNGQPTLKFRLRRRIEAHGQGFCFARTDLDTGRRYLNAEAGYFNSLDSDRRGL